MAKETFFKSTKDKVIERLSTFSGDTEYSMAKGNQISMLSRML